jgi:outer membrane protein insertion porin family
MAMAKRLLQINALAVLVSVGMQTARLQAGSDAESSSKITDVIICDNQRITTEEIKSKLHTHIGDEYNSAKIEEDMRQLNQIHHIVIGGTMKEEDGPGRVKIYFVVRELGDKVQKVTFRGAKHMKEEELRNLTDIRVGMPLDSYKNRLACSHIEAKYEESGRPLSHCTLVKGGEWSDTEVIFDITEGPKVKVKDIQFIGNTFVSSADLARQINSSAPWFASIGGTYNNQKAESDVQALTDYYRKFGYLDVRVALERQRSDDGPEVTLIFHIHEGLRQRPEKR